MKSCPTRMICSLVMGRGEGLEGPRKRGSCQLVKNPPDKHRRCKRCGFNPWVGKSRKFPTTPGVGNGNPVQYSCLGNPMDRKAWRATIHGVAKRQTRLSTHRNGRGFKQNLLQHSPGEVKQVGVSNLCIHGALSGRKTHRGYLRVFYDFEPN